MKARKSKYAEAGKKGGLETVRKYGVEHMREIGKRGASVTWSRYSLAPVGIAQYAMVDRETQRVVAIR